MPSPLRLAPIASFVAAVAAPFACGGASPSAAGAHDASDENPALPRHFEAGAGEAEAGDAADEYTPQAAHCARAGDAGVPALFDAGGDALPDVIALPQVVGSGGPTLSAPTPVSVTFPGDTLADTLDDFVASLGCTPYWRTIGADYGVGDAVAAAPVRLKEAAPASIDDSSIRAWLVKKIDGGDPQFPRPSVPGTIYVLWYPGSTQITLQGTSSCRQFGGYHEGGQLGDGTPFSYAVLPRCQGDDPTGLGALTLAASHELIEACTDPQPETAPAYQLADANHIGWALFAGAEVGDMCELQNDRAYVPPGFPWVVQRIWSNRAAWAGQSPCVPADSPYFYAAAVPTDTATLDLVGTPQSYPAVHVPVGGSATVAVQLLSSGAQGTMQLEAIDPSTLAGLSPVLKLSLDAKVGAPGTTVHLTIQKLSGDPSGAEPFLLQTTMNGRQTLSWGVTSD